MIYFIMHCCQTFCGAAQNAEVAIILHSKRPTSAATSDLNSAGTSADNHVDDDDDAVRHILSDTDPVAGKVRISSISCCIRLY